MYVSILNSFRCLVILTVTIEKDAKKQIITILYILVKKYLILHKQCGFIKLGLLVNENKTK